jgi:hypothetical protein
MATPAVPRACTHWMKLPIQRVKGWVLAKMIIQIAIKTDFVFPLCSEACLRSQRRMASVLLSGKFFSRCEDSLAFPSCPSGFSFVFLCG